MKLSLRVKLMGSFFIVLIMMGLVAYMGIRMGSHLEENLTIFGHDRLPKAEMNGELTNLMADFRSLEIQYIFIGYTGDLAGMKETIAKHNEIKAEIDELNKKLGEMTKSEEGKKLYKEYYDSIQKYFTDGDEMDKFIDAGKFNEAYQLLNGKLQGTFEKADKAMLALRDFNHKQAEQILAESEQEYQDNRTLTLIITFLAFIVSMIIGFVLSRSITNVVNKMVSMLKDMAESGGDLTKRIEVKSKDEIGELAGWFNTFLDKLHDIIGQIKQSSSVVSTAANETSLGNQDLSQRTEEQASSLEEISSTIEEVAASLQKTSEGAVDADKNSRVTLETVQKGESVVKELHKAMEEITKGSHEIAEIIAKVNDIAFQTNLLALNAAVEAARAGEQGRGFAVVAAEVRNLAGRTAESAKEIEGLIKESIKKVTRGNELMQETGSVLHEIVDNTQTTTNVIMEIAASMREQSVAADDIRSAVEQLNQVTQQNASLVEEIAGSSEMVSSEAEEMSALVGKFVLNESVHSASNEISSKRYNGQGSSNSAKASKKIPKNKPQVTKLEAGFNEDDFEKF